MRYGLLNSPVNELNFIAQSCTTSKAAPNTAVSLEQKDKTDRILIVNSVEG
jgi:hypothetical protein